MHLMFSGTRSMTAFGTLLVERQQDGVDGLGRLQHLVDGDLGVIAMRDDVVGLPGAGHDGLRKRPGDQDFLLAHGTVPPRDCELGRDLVRDLAAIHAAMTAPLTSAAIRTATLSSPSPGKLGAAPRKDAAARGRAGPFRPRGGSTPFMLRALVITLALLAGAKIWAQDRLYRDGAQDALIRAYRERAIAACQSEQIFRAGAGGPLWTRPGFRRPRHRPLQRRRADLATAQRSLAGPLQAPARGADAWPAARRRRSANTTSSRAAPTSPRCRTRNGRPGARGRPRGRRVKLAVLSSGSSCRRKPRAAAPA